MSNSDLCILCAHGDHEVNIGDKCGCSCHGSFTTEPKLTLDGLNLTLNPLGVFVSKSYGHAYRVKFKEVICYCPSLIDALVTGLKLGVK